MLSHKLDRVTAMIATLSDLEVKVIDILNPYVVTPAKENVLTILSHKFGREFDTK